MYVEHVRVKVKIVRLILNSFLSPLNKIIKYGYIDLLLTFVDTKFYCGNSNILVCCRIYIRGSSKDGAIV